ncbi:type II toxin-antitoxin system HigB family toxin [Fundicoccus ignavus]|uniref:type II toxin-antitoxin system HigB family toxin n=1 Tax=Fundicoccus ignavus TaxID=2664442 RepID=UPI00162A996C|nr:type II toxin-antitoxin system HigB family toxin [Fundicoccus ignavus]
MKNQLIITVGTSLLFSKDNLLCDFLKDKQDGSLHEVKLQLKDYLINHLEVTLGSQLSAEVSMVNSLLKGNHLSDSSIIYLVHSDTKDGMFSAEMIQIIFQHFMASSTCKLVTISGLDMTTKSLESIQTGLIAVISELNDLFEQVLPIKEYVIFSPIGGYKSMTMLSHLIASMYQIESWYQFEKAKFPIRIPLLPVSLDASFFLTEPTKQLFKQIYLSNHFNFSELIELKAAPDNIAIAVSSNPVLFYTLEDEAATYVSISPLLINPLEKLKAEFYPDVYFKTTNPEQNGQIYEKFLAAWRTDILEADFRNTFKHELDLKISDSSNNWHVFRAKKGDSLRAIYCIDFDEAAVYFSDIMTHKEYDDLLKNESQRKVFKDKLKANLPADSSQYIKFAPK